MSSTPAATNEAELRIRGDVLIAPVLERVVGMLVARAEGSIDRLDDALLLAEAIAAHAPQFINGGWIAITVRTSPDGLALLVGPLDEKASRKLLGAAELPEVGNVIERLSSDVQHDGDTLSMTLAFGR